MSSTLCVRNVLSTMLEAGKPQVQGTSVGESQ